MFRIRLISFLLLLSIVALSAKEDAQKFFCKSKEDQTELDSGKVDRLLIHHDVVYMFLPTKVLYFKIPYIFNTFKPVIATEVHTESREVNKTKETKEPNVPDPLNDDQSLKSTQPPNTQPLNATQPANGRALNATEPLNKTSTPVVPSSPPIRREVTDPPSYTVTKSATELVNVTNSYQITSIDKTFVVSHQTFVLPGNGGAPTPNLIGLISDNTGNNSVLYEFYHGNDSKIQHHTLKFDPKPGERDPEKLLDENKVDIAPFEYLSDYYFYFQFNNDKARVGLEYYRDHSLFLEIADNSGPTPINTKKNLKRGNETIRFAVYYQAKAIGKTTEFDNSLFEIDTENRIRIHLPSIRGGQPYTSSIFKMSHFFGCHTRFESKEQVKGVLYIANRFYLFVNHYYIRFDDDQDLVDMRFKLENKHFEGGTDLELGEDFRFEKYRTKWVHSFLSTAYLSVLDRSFKIWADQKGELKFDALEDPTLTRILQNCTRQLLNIDTYVFCFEEKEYYPVDKLDKEPAGRIYTYYTDLYPKLPIADLFTGSAVTWETNETLELIFNWKANKFVMLTQAHLFVLSYSSVKVEPGPILVLQPDNIVKLEHRLYEDIDMSHDPVMRPSTPNDDPNPLKSDSFKLLILIGLAVVATVLLLMHLIYKKLTKKPLTKNKSTLIKPDSNKGVKADSRSAKSSINFSKLMDQSQIPKNSLSGKETSQSTRYNKEITGKETTTNLNQFIDQMKPKNDEKSKSSRVLYIDSQTGQPKMKDQNSAAEIAKVAVKSGLNAAERAKSVPKSGVLAKEPSRRGSGALPKEASGRSRKDSSVLLKELSKQGRQGSVVLVASAQGRQGSVVPQPNAQNRKGSNALQLKVRESSGQSTTGSKLANDSRLLAVGSSQFDSETIEGDEKKLTKASTQTRRGSTQSAKVDLPAKMKSTQSEKGASPSRRGSTQNGAGIPNRRGSTQSGAGKR